MKKVGAYLPGAYEEVVDVVDAYVLTEKVINKPYAVLKITVGHLSFSDRFQHLTD